MLSKVFPKLMHVPWTSTHIRTNCNKYQNHDESWKRFLSLCEREKNLNQHLTLSPQWCMCLTPAWPSACQLADAILNYSKGKPVSRTGHLKFPFFTFLQYSLLSSVPFHSPFTLFPSSLPSFLLFLSLSRFRWLLIDKDTRKDWPSTKQCSISSPVRSFSQPWPN